ncbi:MAG TPA: glutathione synthase [Ignavibacteria bacterium]|nr:glutathione synthase [Ignavibacteria bacterium]HQY51518.1 glutathione synthase [Ignavibacteria bacterium]HRB00863.1 glutathione synthase [Ignavibacteria bacterium]
MKIGMVVNDILTEQPGYTTTRLGIAGINRGHEVYLMGLGDMAYDADEKIRARARTVPKKKFKSNESYLKALQGKHAIKDRITVDELDVLLLRSDPASETGTRSWAATAGINFGRIAMRHGVIVLNDPNGLAKAVNKTYFQLFPEEVRPKTLITRDVKEIKEFASEHGGKMVLKPLQGSGGSGVFLVRPEDKSNLNQIVESLLRDGYIIAQEYLPAANDGDIRLFMMNGQPMKYKGKYAAFRRIRHGDDMRSNVHAGGKLAQAVITDEHLRLAEIVRPKLVQDGMFLVGLDIVGDKLMEINVFSPGGLGSAQIFEKVNFNNSVIDALETKVAYMNYYKRKFDNVEMATL